MKQFEYFIINLRFHFLENRLRNLLKEIYDFDAHFKHQNELTSKPLMTKNDSTK